MELVRTFEKRQEGISTVLQFPNNRNVVSVSVVLEESSVAEGCEVAVKYAQNGITTDLITFGILQFKGETELEISVETPISVSHIYAIPSNPDVDLREVNVFEDLNYIATSGYPCYVDKKLEENYYLDTVSVFTPDNGYSHYSVYTSLNGKDFDLLARKSNDQACDPIKGDIYYAGGKEARIIRVFAEYYTSPTGTVINDIKFSGKPSGTEKLERPEISIPDFKDSKYNVDISSEDTYEEVYGIIERRLGSEYKKWFEMQLAENPIEFHDYDYFELSYEDGKILIKGNNGVSLAVGLNRYLKYYCKVNISQVGDQVKMPDAVVPLNEPVFMETKAKVRYAYNYCTLSYSMAFWGENEWRNELDWLALNGVNVVLDATAQEEVWRRFLCSIGYTHEEVLKFIAGPAYYAWAYMANLSGFGGPVHDSWFVERTELARKNHLIMRKLGMYPVLQGYSGMVPNDICSHNRDADIILQGTWCSFERPTMLKTTAPIFRDYAAKFYKAQSEVYGDYSKYFATDPFHEGGNIGDMSASSISYEVLSAMLKENKEAVWIIQSWQNNPSSELLLGLGDVENGKQHALILDLYAEKMPNYKNGHSTNPAHGYSNEFDKTPWLFCMLNNFGGRLGLHGHLDNLAKWIPEAYNTCSCIDGIGITPEASVNNPVLYDFLFECIWQNNAQEKLEEIDLEDWLHEYATRRYGAESVAAQKAWDILAQTVYKAELNNLGQGAPESVINARPSFEIKSASSWGNAVISYDKAMLKKAAELLLNDYEILKYSEGYRYDVVTVLQQILSNTAQDCYNDTVAAFRNGSVEEFETDSKKLLKIADLMEQVTACSEYYLLGRWVEQAKALADNADDFTKMLYELNAKSLITTWGAYNQCETGGLHDYSNRQWSGLIGDYYKPRWEHWIAERIKELKNEDFEENINWFEWEWNWARQNTLYNTEPSKADLHELSKTVLE